MSHVKITGGAGVPVGKEPAPVGQPSLGPGLAGLELGVGVLMPLVDVSSTDAPKESDGFDKRPSVERRDNSKVPVEALANAFASLARGESAVPVRELVKERVGFEKTVDLSSDALGKLVGLELQGSGKLTDAAQKIRTGFLLLGHDAKTKIPGSVVTVAEKITKNNLEAAKSELVAYLKKHEAVLGKSQIDVNQLVLRVLRESYLMTTEVLRDRAEQVKFYNEQKKKIRELAKEARETQAKWAALKTASGQGENWVAPEPFAARKVNTTTGEIYAELMSESDVAAYNAAGTTSKQGNSLQAQAEALYGASQLSPTEKAFLDKAYKDKDGVEDFFDSENDDFITDHFDKLKSIIPKMNADELSKYMPRFIEYLSGGNTDEEELIAIHKAMTPCQALYFFSGYEPQPGASGADGAVKGIGIGAAGAVAGAAASAVATSAAVAAAVAAAAPVASTVTAMGGAALGQALLTAAASGAAAGSIGMGAGAAIGAVVGIAAGLSLWATQRDGLNESERYEIESHFADSAQSIAEQVGYAFDGKLSAQEAAEILALAHAGATPAAVDGRTPVAVGSEKVVNTPDQLEAHIKALEEDLSSVGDDAQLANVDLQNELQKQQQTLQMMSNILKTLHDTAMSVIRKVGG